MAYPTVYMLTRCHRSALLYGTTLTFKTLRDGFPNSRIHVADAASIPEARDEIGRYCRIANAEFVPLQRPLQLWKFMERVLLTQRAGAAVFVDPDVCLWEPIEHWEFTGLVAGRFIPRHACEFTHCVSEPRLHSSLFWIPDVAALRAVVERVRQERWLFHPFMSVMVQVNDCWRHFDVGASLYTACPERMESFTQRHLNCYDHLFAGTYADRVFERLSGDSRSMYEEAHRAVQQDHRSLKGTWQVQERYFAARAALVDV